MTMYKLTATLRGKTSRVLFEAHDDSDAMLSAINRILTKAHKDKLGAWAKGSIELLAPNGRLVETMDAK